MVHVSQMTGIGRLQAAPPCNPDPGIGRCAAATPRSLQRDRSRPRPSGLLTSITVNLAIQNQRRTCARKTADRRRRGRRARTGRPIAGRVDGPHDHAMAEEADSLVPGTKSGDAGRWSSAATSGDRPRLHRQRHRPRFLAGFGADGVLPAKPASMRAWSCATTAAGS